MTTEDAKAIIREGVTDIPITDEIIGQAIDSHRDPLALVIMEHFPTINPHIKLDETHFHFDGESTYRHSKDLNAWFERTLALPFIYRQPVTVRIDGPNYHITLVTDVVVVRESYSECYLELPESHPEVIKDESQYPIGKLINVCDATHVLRFNKDTDAHTYIDRFSSFAHAVDRLEYANDQLQIKPTVDVFDFYL